MFCTSCHVVFDWETMKIDKGNVHNAHYFEWMTSQNNRGNINLEELACGNVEEIYRNLMFKIRGYLSSYSHAIFSKLRYNFELNRIFNGEIIDYVRYNLIKDNFQDYRIQYLDNKISEKSWKSKIAKDTINNEKYKSLIEILEMYITVTSDIIRQLAFQNFDIPTNELDTIFSKTILKFFKFKNHFKESVDDLLKVFGGSLTKRLEYLIYQYGI